MPELEEEILVRIPPEDADSFISASLVSKTWMNIVFNPHFVRRYRARYWTPPALVGFFQNFRFGDPKDYLERFVSGIHSTPLVEPERRLLNSQDVQDFLYPDVPVDPNPNAKVVLDCRHGRVLLYSMPENHLSVWDPVTFDQEVLPAIPFTSDYSSGAVLCVNPGCDHRLCRRVGHQSEFRTVFVGTQYCKHQSTTLVSVYSGPVL
ncbi:hypothetical protein QOZ80_8BG0645680 [Eleusine coracana subsp. coracana]|nr:hypothetical protein QOZ80_8BG0645680 [Eleusine coracana subsp. coracana]